MTKGLRLWSPTSRIYMTKSIQKSKMGTSLKKKNNWKNWKIIYNNSRSKAILMSYLIRSSPRKILKMKKFNLKFNLVSMTWSKKSMKMKNQKNYQQLSINTFKTSILSFRKNKTKIFKKWSKTKIPGAVRRGVVLPP